ncbi:hypothetical protein FA13DRAFT_286400 [Coprinellus micaceus]|uniref:Uncharacterized protein n=1 Tax=Coprinellus micaceus TaxID=71717 RepID=A0A4Y7TF45_COPMI|nr:hypothetical protein FA13DRAFT_286400 [Coprinellus micaceus]
MAYEGQSDAFDEVVRVIGHRCSSSSTSPEVESQLLQRAINAEGREAKLRLEVDDSQKELVRQGKKIKNLQKQLETLRAVKQEVELAVAQEHEARTQLGEQRKQLANKNLETSSLRKELDETHKELARQRMQTSSLQKQLDEMRQELDEFKEVALLKENTSTLQLEAELANKVAENGVLAGRVAQLQEAVSKLNNQSKTENTLGLLSNMLSSQRGATTSAYQTDRITDLSDLFAFPMSIC